LRNEKENHFNLANNDQSKEYVDIPNFVSAMIMLFVLCFYLQIIVIIFKKQKKQLPEVQKQEISSSEKPSIITVQKAEKVKIFL